MKNALFKMYGYRDAGYCIKSIANGGIDYVKSILDLYNTDLDNDNNKPKGYTPLNILSFCIRFKILCYGYDYNTDRFITSNDWDYDIKFNHNLPVFVFVF